MAFKSDESIELFNELVKRGYSSEFCKLISNQLNTTWTAKRMLGYLRHLPTLKEEDIVDEMLGILSDRDRIRQKKELEHAQSVINRVYEHGLCVEEEDEV